MHCRHIYALRPDVAGVVIPDSILASSVIAIYPEDSSTRFDTFIHAPNNIPPQFVTDILKGAFADFETLDATQAVRVTPWKPHPELSAIEYRIRLYARNAEDISDLMGETLRRS
ncbi:MAG: hypothetical protein ACI82O_003493 [Patiriisocius sp.]|jgi:hypothetical protein